MTLNSKLMKAILAMDAYNRSYNEGIEINGSQIGNALIATTLDDNQNEITLDSRILLNYGQREDVPIGFYAIAYEYEGETAVPCRGMDALPQP